MGKNKVKHIINWNYIATIFTVIGIVVALIIYGDNSETSNLTSSIQLQELKIQGYKDQINTLESKTVQKFYEEVNQISKFYENKAIINRLTYKDSLLLIEKKFNNVRAPGNLNRDSIDLALSYGSQAIDLLEIADSKINNQKKIIEIYEKIVKGKNSMIKLIRKSK